jgi:L-threonylcarbamoyladenylate synthase
MMKITTLQDENMSAVVLQAGAILSSGGILISPTDTVYGILGSAASAPALKRIFQLKNRPGEKALPVFVRDISIARQIAYISDTKARFLERVWPEPVTVVFHHKEKLPKMLTGGLGTIGIRIPSDPFLMELLKCTDIPLAQTSANLSTQPPAETIDQIKHYFEKSKNQPDLVIDRGALYGRPSTVIDFTGTEPIILRTGIVSPEELDRMLNDL